MFDIGWTELFIISAIALIVIGPKDLPAAMRTVAKLVGRLRGMSRDFQSGVSEIMREAEVDDLKRKFNEAGRLKPDRFVKDQIDPDGSLSADFDPRAFARDVTGGAAKRKGDASAKGKPKSAPETGGGEKPQPDEGAPDGAQADQTKSAK